MKGFYLKIIKVLGPTIAQYQKRWLKTALMELIVKTGKTCLFAFKLIIII